MLLWHESSDVCSADNRTRTGVGTGRVVVAILRAMPFIIAIELFSLVIANLVTRANDCAV